MFFWVCLPEYYSRGFCVRPRTLNTMWCACVYAYDHMRKFMIAVAPRKMVLCRVCVHAFVCRPI